MKFSQGVEMDPVFIFLVHWYVICNTALAVGRSLIFAPDLENKEDLCRKTSWSAQVSNHAITENKNQWSIMEGIVEANVTNKGVKFIKFVSYHIPVQFICLFSINSSASLQITVDYHGCISNSATMEVVI